MPRYSFDLHHVIPSRNVAIKPLNKDLIDDAAAYEYAESELKQRPTIGRIDIYRQVGAVEVTTTFNRTSVPDGNLQNVEQA